MPLEKPSVPCIGIDEAGVGPWAGPVVAGAAFIHPSFYEKLANLDINDSKKLTAKKRQAIYNIIFDLRDPHNGFDIAFGIASVEEIDTLNIRKATHLAMTRAAANIKPAYDHIFVDGNHSPTFKCPTTCIIKGDQKLIPIALGSIIAKVTRDNLMNKLHEEYPLYGWANNAGYGTQEHQEALKAHGVTPHHRTSYAPIRALL